MRDQWYGDKRDVLKWSVLVHLARAHHANTILQIVFYVAEPLSHELNADGQTLRVPAEVWSHFRNVHHVGRLKSAIDVDIKVFDKPFSHKTRGAYTQDAMVQIDSLKAHKLVVLLDPDTGIQPARVGATHVAEDELRCFYGAIKEGDVLCLYQHARRDAGWLEKTRKQFATALQLAPSEIRTFCTPARKKSHPNALARDVAILAVTKQRSQ